MVVILSAFGDVRVPAGARSGGCPAAASEARPSVALSPVAHISISINTSIGINIYYIVKQEAMDRFHS